MRLRPFRASDLEDLAVLFGNPDFMRFSMGPYDREKTGEILNKILGWDRDGKPSQFAVELLSSGALLGYCGFFHHEEVAPDLEIGYRLHPDYWNRGIISEAARAVCDHGFCDLNLPRVISLIHPANLPSRRVAEKNGMTVEKQITFRGFPTNVFAISRQQWLKLRGGLTRSDV